MTFLRGNNPETSIWARFRPAGDGFMVQTRDGAIEVRVALNAERSVDLFHALLENLPPAVSVRIEELRNGERWSASGVALPDVRDAVARLRLPLATFAGVDISIYTDDEQATLAAHLELHLFARTERWIYLLRGLGLREVPVQRRRSWRLGPGEFPPAPELAQALRQVVGRLSLAPVKE